MQCNKWKGVLEEFIVARQSTIQEVLPRLYKSLCQFSVDRSDARHSDATTRSQRSRIDICGTAGDPEKGIRLAQQFAPTEQEISDKIAECTGRWS